MGFCDVAHAVYCDQNNTPDPGYWCHNLTVTDCRPGCWCPGGYRSTATTQNVQNKCSSHQNPGLEEFGVNLCPDNYRYSDAGASSINECYNTTTCDTAMYLPANSSTCATCPPGKRCPGYNVAKTYYSVGYSSPQGAYDCTGNGYSAGGTSSCFSCGAGKYVNEGHTACISCGAGFACTGNGLRTQCTGNGYSSVEEATTCTECGAGYYVNDFHTQCSECGLGYACDGTGTRTQCTGKWYSGTTNATSCTECTGAGKAVTKTGGLNTGCAVCGTGLYAVNNASCEACRVGYRCNAGVAYKCTGNEYSAYTNSTACTTCSGEGYGVQYTIDITVRPNETLNTGCARCEAGMYGNNGICETCPPKHWCQNGLDKGVCQNGTCASTDGISCANNGGGTQCITCPDGQYGEDGECKVCPAGYYCTGGQKLTCPVGTCTATSRGVCTRNTGATQCVTCPDGQYGEDGECKVCPAGYYCTGGLQHTCEAGQCTSINGNSCTGGAGATQCINCPSNTYSNGDRTACVACAGIGEYIDNNECKSCASVAYNTNLYNQVRLSGNTGESMCGLELNTSVSGCAADSDVKWYLSNGSWTLVSGSVAHAGLNGFVKDPVPTSPFGRDEDVDWCSQCESGTFNMSGGSGEESCGACPAGYCTSGNNCLPCQPGYYCPGSSATGNARQCGYSLNGYGRVCEEDDTQSRCRDFLKCPKGSFSGEAQAACTYCALGYTTEDSGTAYNPGDNLSDLCTKIIIKLKVNNIETPIFRLPACLTEGKINKSIVKNN